MVQCANSAGVLWLRCGTHHRKNRTGRTCHANNIKLDEVLNVVLDDLAGIVDVDVLNERLTESIDREALQGRLDEIDRQLQACDVKRNRLGHAYAAGSMDLAVYREVDDQVIAGAEALEAEAVGIRSELARVVDPVVRLTDIQELVDELRDNLDVLSSITVATALRNVGLRVFVENGRVVRSTLA